MLFFMRAFHVCILYVLYCMYIVDYNTYTQIFCFHFVFFLKCILKWWKCCWWFVDVRSVQPSKLNFVYADAPYQLNLMNFFFLLKALCIYIIYTQCNTLSLYLLLCYTYIHNHKKHTKTKPTKQSQSREERTDWKVFSSRSSSWAINKLIYSRIIYDYLFSYLAELISVKVSIYVQYI